jgi:hypothetical protein
MIKASPPMILVCIGVYWCVLVCIGVLGCDMATGRQSGITAQIGRERPGSTSDESGGEEQSSEGRLAGIGAMDRSERPGSLPFPDFATSAVSRAQYPILRRDCQGLF